MLFISALAVALLRPTTVVTPCWQGLSVRPTNLAEGKVFDKQPFPLCLSPTDGEELASWGAAKRGALLRLVQDFDAVLLRGFAAESAQDFSDFVTALDLQGFEMGCSAAPRTNVAPGVFTANEAPPTEPIPFHHEMAQCDERPEYVMFFCEVPAQMGGATPIIPSHAVATYLRKAHPELASELAERGVRYVRVLPEENDPTSPIGKSWRAAFEVDTKSVRTLPAFGPTRLRHMLRLAWLRLASLRLASLRFAWLGLASLGLA